MLMKELHHKSVMIEEVLSILKPSDGKIYIDGTLGCLLYTSDAADE